MSDHHHHHHHRRPIYLSQAAFEESFRNVTRIAVVLYRKVNGSGEVFALAKKNRT
jgi:hypothetical protein